MLLPGEGHKTISKSKIKEPNLTDTSRERVHSLQEPLYKRYSIILSAGDAAHHLNIALHKKINIDGYLGSRVIEQGEDINNEKVAILEAKVAIK